MELVCLFLVVFKVFKQASSYFSCLGERCVTVKLQKCFVDYEKLPLTFCPHVGEEMMTGF